MDQIPPAQRRVHRPAAGRRKPATRCARRGSTATTRTRGGVDLWGRSRGQRARCRARCFPYYARPLEEDAEAVRAFTVDPNIRSICKRTAEGLDEMLRGRGPRHRRRARASRPWRR